MHGKCTNKTCPYDHEVLKSVHNKKIINTRGLSFLSDNTLLELARVSADPTRSVKIKSRLKYNFDIFLHLVLGMYRSWKKRWLLKKISV
jgi:hypothetical protein